MYVHLNNRALLKVSGSDAETFLQGQFSNDIEKLLGPPSTKGAFNEDLWIFIERKTSSSKLLKLNKQII